MLMRMHIPSCWSHFLDLQLGMQDLCNPVQGNFLKMPFEKESFDGAYAIEATCHANKVQSLTGSHNSGSAVKSWKY